ncbi:MAG: ECF transporter S component [Oscillospiraceae bacterium]|nr:ECF transporter S component [Oscillospiraceae bacterium]
MTNNPTAARTLSTRKIVVTAMLSAVAFALQFIEFPIPMLIPSFVKMDVSDLPELLGAFALGPVYGAVIALLKNLLHIVIKGTSSGGVGELCNFLLGVFFVVPAGAIYQAMKPKDTAGMSRQDIKKQGLKAAIIGSLAGAVLMAVCSVPLNYFLTYPIYTKFMPMEAIIGMYQVILPSVKGLLQCLIIFNMPFTFVKGLLDVVICFLIYKPLSPILHGK